MRKPVTVDVTGRMLYQRMDVAKHVSAAQDNDCDGMHGT